jgi:hypothetical protein
MAGVAADSLLYNSQYLVALRQWKPWVSGGVVPACAFFLAWWTFKRRRDWLSALGALALGIALCAAFGQFGWNAWTRVDYPESERAQFAGWRQQIPPSAQVLWMGSPWPVWYLLERPSYWSASQMAASVYSEPLARELARRQAGSDHDLPEQSVARLLRNHLRHGPEPLCAGRSERCPQGARAVVSLC